MAWAAGAGADHFGVRSVMSKFGSAGQHARLPAGIAASVCWRPAYPALILIPRHLAATSAPNATRPPGAQGGHCARRSTRDR